MYNNHKIVLNKFYLTFIAVRQENPTKLHTCTEWLEKYKNDILGELFDKTIFANGSLQNEFHDFDISGCFVSGKYQQS